MAYRTTNAGGSATVSSPSVSEDMVTKNPPDTHIWGVYGCLVALSIIELYSASSFEIAKMGLYAPLLRHVGQLFVGFLIICGLQRVHYRHFYQAGRVLCVLSIIAMFYVLIFGKDVNGAKRAIALPFISLQPPEFIKLSAVVVVAGILATTQLKKDSKVRDQGIYMAAGVVILLGGLLFTQGLTNTLIMMVISTCMFLMGALEKKKLLRVGLIYIIAMCCGIGLKVVMTKLAQKDTPDTKICDARGNVFDVPELATGAGSRLSDNTWINRITTFSDTVPAYRRDITQGNLQEMRSYMAQANGGWFGVFPGNSRETSRLPLAFSDFIFAIIVEDLGFVGGIFVMILYLWLLARAYMIARKCNQIYPALLVTGCALLITTQALAHMAIVSGAGPVSGQPLPLFSKGGTSILVTSIAFGIMLSVSRFSVRDKNADKQQLKREQDALPAELQGQNPTQF